MPEALARGLKWRAADIKTEVLKILKKSMSNLSLHTSSKDYFTLIGNGASYHVPPYQRDYSWTEDQWEDLWTDMLGLEQEHHHYLGYIVLQQHGNGKDFWIIDGQQRFTTLAILSLGVEQLLKEWSDNSTISDVERRNNKERADSIHKRFLGNYSISTLSTTSKLFLNRNNRDFFASHLMSFREPSRGAKLKPSQKLLFKASQYFRKKLQEKFPTPDGGGLAKFIEDDVAPRLIFTAIEVNDEFNAYKVFETLNARGVHLSPADLLKNYFFFIAVKNDSTDFEEAERLWQSIHEKLGEEDVPTFLRHFWNSRNEFVRSAELYRSIRSKVKTQSDVFTFLHDLDDIAEMYVALNDPASKLWIKEQQYPVKILKMFRVSACYPVLMAAFDKWKPNEFTKLLKEMVVLTFRRTIIGHLGTNEMEPVFNRCAMDIFSGKLKTAKQMFEQMRPLYVKDTDFTQAFALKTFSFPFRKDVVRYILAELENHISRKKEELQFDISPFSIEHILPQNPGSVWNQEFTPAQQEECVTRLGNMTLQEEKLNNSKKMNHDKSFAEKKLSYDQSAYLLTKMYFSYVKWCPEAIDDRQNKMAELAIEIWKSLFVSPRKSTSKIS